MKRSFSGGFTLKAKRSGTLSFIQLDSALELNLHVSHEGKYSEKLGFVKQTPSLGSESFESSFILANIFGVKTKV